MQLRRERLLPDGEGHRKTADIPDETCQFACDRNHRDVLLLAARDELPIAPAQAHLRIPGAINDALGDPSWRRWISGLTRAGCW